jgi:hypothetical protein
VTHKKSLVQSDLPIISTNTPKLDTVSHGYIVSVNTTGCLVGLYGGITVRKERSEREGDK